MRTFFFLIAFFACASTSSAEIYQWYDGDENGSLWLSDSIPQPYADLSGQVLWWADLANANLHHADLSQSNVMFSNLIGTDLSVSNLMFANLYAARLDWADFAFAMISGANLRSTSVYGANFFYADITDADLTGMGNWEDAFWVASRYNSNTIFPTGMNPNDLGMIEIAVPAPGMLCLVSFSLFFGRRRRSA